MKKFLIFTILLLSNPSVIWACGYSPMGEDVRFCMFRPSYFDYSHFQSFNYNADLWSLDYSPDTEYESNVTDWYNYTHKKVAIESINQFLNALKFTDINKDSQNDFIQYFYKNKDFSVLEYLAIAKKCEDVNNLGFEDPWERSEGIVDRNANKIIAELYTLLQKEKNPDLKRKYAFQAIRLAYYSKDLDKIKSLYTTYFENTKKDYLYYWSLYFYCFTNPAQKELKIAEIFSNSREKAHAVYYYFHNDYDFNKAISEARNKQEIAQVYAYISVQKIDKNLDYLKEIYTNQSQYELLDFLVLREVNKIEDWVYTPYYTNYLPSIENANSWNSTDKVTTETLRLRSENDRLYAKEVLAFVENVNLNTIKNKVLWLSAKIQLQFMSREYDNCLTSIASFEAEFKNEKVAEEVEKIKALCLTNQQENGKTIILPAIESIVLKYHDDKRFIFALGRELEFKGNIADGIALISSLEYKKKYSFYDEYGVYDSLEWTANRLKYSGNLPYFYSYFDYLDFVYTAQDLQTIVIQIEKRATSPFYEKLYRKLVEDKNNLIDLLGTKYLRENNLTASYSTFRLLNDNYWSGYYNGWERGEYADYYTFDRNPFYSFNSYTKDFIPHKEKFIVTKKSVLQHIIKYVNLAFDPKNPDRDYYYFLLGNCYYNMSQYGNSWMLRRYSSSSNYYEDENALKESYFDEMEYRKNKIAVHYYKLAYQTARTDKFKALCLRMMDYAEKQNYSTSPRVKASFPEYENDLSGCENLEEYFNARR